MSSTPPSGARSTAAPVEQLLPRRSYDVTSSHETRSCADKTSYSLKEPAQAVLSMREKELSRR